MNPKLSPLLDYPYVGDYSLISLMGYGSGLTCLGPSHSTLFGSSLAGPTWYRYNHVGPVGLLVLPLA